MSTTKKQKTTEATGPPLFSSVALSELTVDPALQGKGEGNK